MVDVAHPAIRRDPKVNWIVNAVHTESFVVLLQLARSLVDVAREPTTPRPSEVPAVPDGSGRTPSVSAESVRRLEVDEARLFGTFNYCFYYFLLLLVADG